MSNADDAPVYPAGLIVGGRKCLVVGGGRVAARKIRGLLACGAAVTVVAPEVHEAITLLAASGDIDKNIGPPLDVQVRRYADGEAAGYRLVLTATGDPEVDGKVHRDAEAAGVWVNSADDASRCTFILPAVLRDGPVTVAVSTSGSSPALATWLRGKLAVFLGGFPGSGLGELARLLSQARDRVKASGRPTADVDWKALLEGPLPSLVAEGKLEEARALLQARVGLDNPC